MNMKNLIEKFLDWLQEPGDENYYNWYERHQILVLTVLTIVWVCTVIHTIINY